MSEIGKVEDPCGLKIYVSVDFGHLIEIARESLRASIGASQIVEVGERDPDGVVRGELFGDRHK